MAAEVAGSVVERDLMEALFSGSRALADRVEDHMSAPLPGVGSGEPVGAAVEAPGEVRRRPRARRRQARGRPHPPRPPGPPRPLTLLGRNACLASNLTQRRRCGQRVGANPSALDVLGEPHSGPGSDAPAAASRRPPRSFPPTVAPPPRRPRPRRRSRRGAPWTRTNRTIGEQSACRSKRLTTEGPRSRPAAGEDEHPGGPHLRQQAAGAPWTSPRSSSVRVLGHPLVVERDEVLRHVSSWVGLTAVRRHRPHHREAEPGLNGRTSWGQPHASATLPAHTLAAASSATSTMVRPPRYSLVSA